MAALHRRYALTNLWDIADDTQKQRILEVLIAAQQCATCVHHHGCVLYMNRCLEKITGIPLSEIHGKSALGLFVDPVSQRRQRERAASDAEENYVCVMRFPTGDMTMSISSYPITWYGEHCRIVLLTPLIIPEWRREWEDIAPVLIGEKS